jgi:hypothetical protein
MQDYLGFETARESVRALGLKTRQEWYDYCKSGSKPNNIPEQPEAKYKNDGWIGYADWLGNGKVSPKDYLSFSEAQSLAEQFHIESGADWRREWRAGVLKRVPCYPEQTYRKEWKGWKHFLKM